MAVDRRESRAEESIVGVIGPFVETIGGAFMAASTSEATAVLGRAAVLSTMDINNEEIPGATEAAELAEERKSSAEEAAAPAACPSVVSPLVASGTGIAAEATAPRRDESWETTAVVDGRLDTVPPGPVPALFWPDPEPEPSTSAGKGTEGL